MSKSNDKEQWGLFEEDSGGNRTRLGTDTFTSADQANTAVTEARKRLQESPDGPKPTVSAKRILNG